MLLGGGYDSKELCEDGGGRIDRNVGESEKGAKLEINAVDLFCGFGGLTHGLARVGILMRAGLDNKESCRFACEANNLDSRHIEADLSNIAREHIERVNASRLYEPASTD